MVLETFLTMLLVVSIFSGLFTEAVKKALNSVDTVIVSNNILAGIVSVFLSFFCVFMVYGANRLYLRCTADHLFNCVGSAVLAIGNGGV